MPELTSDLQNYNGDGDKPSHIQQEVPLIHLPGRGRRSGGDQAPRRPISTQSMPEHLAHGRCPLAVGMRTSPGIVVQTSG